MPLSLERHTFSRPFSPDSFGYRKKEKNVARHLLGHEKIDLVGELDIALWGQGILNENRWNFKTPAAA
ncbi:hypothetical protein [Dictyobacter aurantiacus]|uniref:Uncharacterized protein n=1 Tax=Dictyobacter aurantiacus TaxID=1936993 RepID=A0A401ZHA6_9CHLR|nr:hypothetical protein [Dictyobacter aurantiacus]GCE06078.1 hypothetical protein KDAU_34070 [Dictyobacter aurantiacus]